MKRKLSALEITLLCALKDLLFAAERQMVDEDGNVLPKDATIFRRTRTIIKNAEK